MTQLLSLAFGNSSPSGLSGGAAPFAGQGPSFAALLTAQSPQEAMPQPGLAGLRASTAMIPASVEPLARTSPVPSTFGAIPVLEGAVLRPAPTAPQPPSARMAGSVPTAISVEPTVVPSQAVEAPIATDQPPIAERATAPAEREAIQKAKPTPTAPVELVEDTDAPAAVPASVPAPALAVPPPSAQAPQAETTRSSEPAPLEPEQHPITRAQAQTVPEPVRETAEKPAEQAPEMEQAPDNTPEFADTKTAPLEQPVDEPASAPTEAAAPEIRPAGEPSPATIGVVLPHAAALRRPVETGGDPAPMEISAGSSQPSPVTKDIRQASEAASPRPSLAMAPETGATRDFAQALQANAGEAAAPAAEGGAATADLLPQMRTDPARHSVETARPMAAIPDTVSARPGEIGRQLGVEIVRHGLDGRDSLTIRLDPVEMGEIQVRLQFDDKGTMRAHVTAESSVALEMLRRDSGDLVRALGDAGVRTDAQSFQFEARSHGRDEQQGQHARPENPSATDTAHTESDADDDAQPTRAKLRNSGSLDLFA